MAFDKRMYASLKVHIILIILIISDAKKPDKIDWSDLNKSTPQLIESRNFKSETHFMTTSDGYILQIFRIINPYLKDRIKSLKPIILQHGFLGSSDEYLIAKKGYLSKSGKYIEDGHIITDCKHNKKLGKTLAFVLSACGYDVWLSNIRGNKYNQKHISLNPGQFKFWEFTFDELGLIDLPTIINYIGVRTKNERIGFIGYSFGSTLMFILLSSKPEYSSIIDPFIAIAPMVYSSKTKFVAYKSLYPLFRAIPFPLIRSYPLRELIRKLFNISTEDSQVNQMSGHLEGRTSSLIIAHWVQIMVKDRFARFDWGLFDNYLRYGSPHSPEYSLANITSSRIALFQHRADIFSDYEDMKRLKQVLKVQLLLDYWIPDKNWTHSDYLFNQNTDIYVNSVIIKLLKLN